MSKITLSTVSELQAFPSAAANINSNSATLTTAMDNTLSRDGTQPNSMNANLDMNSNRILNLPAPVSNLEPARLVDLETLTGAGTITVNPVPTGGTTGQALIKNSNANFDTGWGSVSGIPVGGTANQVLAKNTGTNFDVSWKSSAVPTGGTTGQYLSKINGTDYNTTWSSLPSIVAGPVSSLDNAAARFDGTSGLIIQNSSLIIDDTTATLSRNGGGGIPLQGTNTNDAAASGYVGEILTSEVTYASRFGLVSGTASTITSMTLTAGDWDVTAVAGFETTGGGVASEYHIEISTTAPPTIITAPNQGGTVGIHITCVANQGQAFPAGPRQVLISVPTTVYLKCLSTFTFNQTAYGFLRARRIR